MNMYLKKLMIAQFLETFTDRGSPSSWMWCEMRCTSTCLWPPLPVPLHPREADVALRFLFSQYTSSAVWAGFRPLLLAISTISHLFAEFPVKDMVERQLPVLTSLWVPNAIPAFHEQLPYVLRRTGRPISSLLRAPWPVECISPYGGSSQIS